MRDYAQFFFTADDTPYATTAVVQNYFFATRDECDAFVAANDPSPGGGKLSATMPIWFRYDRDILLGYMNAAFLTNLGTPSAPVFSGDKQMIYFESPRSFGVNSFVEKRESPGPGDSGAAKSNVSGAGALLAFANSLLTTEQLLRKAGDSRSAGIVRFAYDRILDQTFSITQAIIYLEKNLPQIFH
jgi:hypothetical protein